jgi:hypothetical protein
MVAVSLEVQAGATLLVRARGVRIGETHRYTHPAATPGKMADIIRLAVSNGWRAREPGKPFELRVDSAL